MFVGAEMKVDASSAIVRIRAATDSVAIHFCNAGRSALPGY
jgi:hypothetical protein